MLQLLSSMVTEYKMFDDKSRTENLGNAINKAYELTLKRHHGFVSKQLFKVLYPYFLFIYLSFRLSSMQLHIGKPY